MITSEQENLLVSAFIDAEQINYVSTLLTEQATSNPVNICDKNINAIFLLFKEKSENIMNNIKNVIP